MRTQPGRVSAGSTWTETRAVASGRHGASGGDPASVPRRAGARPRRTPLSEPSVRRLGVHNGAEEVEVRVDLDGQTRVHQRIDVGF